MDAVDYAIAIVQRNEAGLTALYVVSSPTIFGYTSYTPEDQIPEIAKDIVHQAKKESQPWFNEITEKVRTRAADVTLKEDTKKTNSIIQLKTQVVVSPISAALRNMRTVTFELFFTVTDVEVVTSAAITSIF